MHLPMKVVAVAVGVVVAVLGGAWGACPEADLSRDCQVDFLDLQILSEQWLAAPEQPADLDLDDEVQFDDFALLAQQWGQRGISLVINEVMASNGGTVQDPQGEYEDWIEIYNFGREPIDVGGMYLTDDLDEPRRWRFPEDRPELTTIEPDGLLLVWADNDVNDEGLHAGFALDAAGDEVGLFDRDGKRLIDSVEFGDQTTGISYGRFPDGEDQWYSMLVPTPWWKNIHVYQGQVEQLEFSHERGFYSEPFSVTIASETEGVLIYYSLDGSSPYKAAGGYATGLLYTGPIRIEKTTCLRAVGIKPGWKPTSVATHTYIFVDDVIRQSPHGEAPGPGWPVDRVNGQVIDYGMDPEVVNDPRYRDLMDDALLALPSISLVTDLKNLFDPVNGIYVNARNDGRAWERPVSVELLDPNGGEGFQINAGLRIRGGYSRSGNNPKHAFRLFFRPEYGAPELRFALFGDEGAKRFRKVDLRTAQNYSWSFGGDSRNTMVRDVFSRDLQGEMGQPYTRSRYYHLYLNGQYWGIFQTQERSEACYAETYLGGRREDYDVVKVEAGAYVVVPTDGTLDAYRRLWEAARAGFDTDEAYYRIQGLNKDGTRNPEYERLVDVNNLIDYMLCTFYVGDFDGPISNFLGNNRPNNFYGTFNRNNPDGFKFFRHDAEHSLLDRSWGYDRTGPFPAGEQFQHFNPQWLHQQLVAHPEYRMRLADRAHKYFFGDGLMTPEASTERLMRRARQIETAIIAESARWGDSKASRPRTRDDDWWPAVRWIVDEYFPIRTGIVLSQLRAKGWYPSVDAPTLSPRGGVFDPSVTVTMSAPRGVIYYTLDGSDPRLPESPGGSASTVTLVSASSPKRVLVPSGPVEESWRSAGAYDDSSWSLVSGSPGGVGYERSSGYEGLISLDVEGKMYGKATSCYVRIAFSVDTDPNTFTGLTLKMRYDDGFVAYLNGVEIQRVLFSGEPSWNSHAEGDHEANGWESFYVSDAIALLRTGENILAIHGLNKSSTSSDFVVMAELVASQGAGSTGGGIAASAVEYTGPIVLSKSTHIKARALSGGVWSALEEGWYSVGPVLESLRVTEVMYHPADTNDANDPNEEFIELQNIGSRRINLNLVRFTEGIRYTFSDLELEPGGFVLLVRDREAFETRYGAGLAVAGEYVGRLDNDGERICLKDAVGRVIVDFAYKDGWYKHTDGEGFSLTVRASADIEDPNIYADKNSWRASVRAGGSPGYDDSGILPEPGAVVINEVLAHSHGQTGDWIELYNTTDSPVSIGGWYLSDSSQNLKKYRIASGMWIEPHSYRVFYQETHFGNASDPGCREPFALSENGDQVYLSPAEGEVLTGYRESEDFGASATGVSLGRYYKQSTGNYNFVALSEPTPGRANAYPLVGPVVISEIMYHPDWPEDGFYANDRYEYIELHNISDEPVTLYRYDKGKPWKFTAGIEFTFPGEPNEVTIPAGGFLLVVRDPNAFFWRWPTVPAELVLGPYEGRLSNSGERLELSMPGDVDRYGRRYYIRVDRVVYSDGSHPEQCPGGVDLQRPGPLLL